MKQRIGFVSNSSTASFILLKPKVSIDKIKEMIGVIEETAEAVREYHSIPGRENMFGKVKVVKKDGDPFDWGTDEYNYYTGATAARKGDIIIFGASDNSIPFDVIYMFTEMLEKLGEGALHIHLG